MQPRVAKGTVIEGMGQEMGDGARYKETALAPDNVLTVEEGKSP